MTEKMRCQFCSLDFTSAYKIVPHIYFGHRKKIVRLSREKGEIKLVCPTAECSFDQTSKMAKGTAKEQLFETFSASLNHLLDHVRTSHTHEVKIEECPYCQKNLDNIIYWEHLEEHMNNTTSGKTGTSQTPTPATTTSKSLTSPTPAAKTATDKSIISPASTTNKVESNDISATSYATSGKTLSLVPCVTAANLTAASIVNIVSSLSTELVPSVATPSAELLPKSVVFPAAETPIPAAKPATPVETPTAKPAAPVSTSGTKPATPVETPTAKPASPVKTSGTKPATPVETPTAKPADPVKTSGTKPATPVETPAAKPTAPVITSAAKPVTPMETPAAKPVSHVETPAAKPDIPIKIPVAKPSSLATISTEPMPPLPIPTAVEIKPAKAPKPVATPTNKPHLILSVAEPPSPVAKHPAKSTHQVATIDSTPQPSLATPTVKPTPPVVIPATKLIPIAATSVAEPLYPVANYITEPPPQVANPATEPLYLASEPPGAANLRVIPVAVVNPVAAISPSALTPCPLPPSVTVTADSFSSPSMESPQTGTIVDDSSICTPPSIKYVSSVDTNILSVQTDLANISPISSSNEAPADSSKQPADAEQKHDVPDIDISPRLSIETIFPVLAKQKQTKDLSKLEEKSINSPAKAVEETTIIPIKKLKLKTKTDYSKQKEKIGDNSGNKTIIKHTKVEKIKQTDLLNTKSLPLNQNAEETKDIVECGAEIQTSKSMASPREKDNPAECTVPAKSVASFTNQSLSMSLGLTPTLEVASCKMVKTPEDILNIDSVSKITDNCNKDSSLSPAIDSDCPGIGAIERSSSNTPLQDERTLSQSDVSISQTPATPAALSPREKSVDKDEETDLEKELGKLKALKEKVLPPPPKILPPKSVSRRRSSREEPRIATKKPLLTEEMERKIIYGDVLKPKAKSYRPGKSEEKVELSRQEKLSAVRKEIEAVFHKEEERSLKEKSDKRKKERDERAKLKREQAAIEKRRRSIDREHENEVSLSSVTPTEAGTPTERNRKKEKLMDSVEERFKGDDRMEAKLKEHFVGLGYGDNSSSPSPPPSPRQRSSHKLVPQRSSYPSPLPPKPPSPPPSQHPRTPPPPKMSRATRDQSPLNALNCRKIPQEEAISWERIKKLKSPPRDVRIGPPSPAKPEKIETCSEERGWREDRKIGGGEVEAWMGGKKLEIGGDSMALIRETYGDDDMPSPVKEVIEPLKRTIPKGFDELGRPLNDPMEIAPRPIPINPVLAKAANNAARGIMGPARARAGGDVDPQLMCSLCKEDGQSAAYFSAYQLLSHVFLAHRKKIVSRSRKNRGMILACPDGCGFVTGTSSAGVSIEYYNGQLPVHLDQLSEHIRVQHTGEDRMIICQFCQFPLEHSEGWSWQHLANHRDSRREYCSACNTFPFLNEVHKCTGDNKPNPLPPPVSVMGDPMPQQTKAENKFGKYQRFNQMEGKRTATNAKETSLERLARQLETGQLDASLLEGGKVGRFSGKIEQIGKPDLIGEVERFDCVVCTSYWPKAGAWVSHMRQEHLGKGALKRKEQLACWCCNWTPQPWEEGLDIVAVGQLLEHVNVKHRGDGRMEQDWEEEVGKMEKLEREVLRQRDREKEEAGIEIPEMPAECEKCGDVLEDAGKYKRHYLGHKYGEVFCAICQQWIFAHLFSDHMKVCNEEELKKVKVIIMNSKNNTWFEVHGKKIKVVFDFHESEEQGAAAVAKCEINGEQLNGVGVTIEAATKALQEEVMEHFSALREEMSREDREMVEKKDGETLLEMFKQLAAVDAGKGKKYWLVVEGKSIGVETGWRLGEKGDLTILAACWLRGREVRGEGKDVAKALKDLKGKVAVEYDKMLKCEKCGSEFSKQVCFQMHRMVNCVR